MDSQARHHITSTQLLLPLHAQLKSSARQSDSSNATNSDVHKATASRAHLQTLANTFFGFFKENRMIEIIITAAIILGFILNIVFVDHPNSTSYTVAFVLSLLVEAVILGMWWMWRKQRRLASRPGTESEPLRGSDVRRGSAGSDEESMVS